MSTWEKAERLFLGYLDKRLADFYSQIPDELRSRIQPKEERRRLLEAGKPQAKIEDPIDVLVKSIPREQYPKVTEELRKNYVKLRAEQLGVSPEDFERGLAKFEYQAKPIAHKDSKRGK